MKVEIKVPAMGESISEATVGQLLKKNGTLVQMDDEILELETDKVNQVLYAPETGIIEIKVNSDDVVKIGEVIGYINTDKESATQNKPLKEFVIPPEPSPSKKNESSVPTSEPSVRISKEEYLSSLSEKKHPSPIQKEDKKIKKTEISDSQNPTPSSNQNSPVTRKKMSKLRQVIAKRLVEVQSTTAMLTTFNEVDLSPIMELRQKYQEVFQKKYEVKLGLMSFFVKAAVSGLKAFPEINAYIDGSDIVYLNSYDISIAVSTEKGLIVPVVRGCDRRSFANIEKEIQYLAQKARTGGLSMDDLQGGGFTITNGGIYGSLLSTPILNPPQSAILGMHTIQKRAVVVNDEIVVRPMMYLALSYDHRIVDGKEAVSFLIHIKQILEEPSRLLLDI